MFPPFPKGGERWKAKAKDVYFCLTTHVRVFFDVAVCLLKSPEARVVVMAKRFYFEFQRAWPAPTIINADRRFMSYPLDIGFSKEVTL